MDRLQHIFELQARLDAEIEKNHRLPEYDLPTWVQKEALAIIAELAELLEEVNFKWWKNPHPLNRDALKEELADILHFFVSMCLKVGVSAEELYRAYLTKNEENFRRQRGLSSRGGYSRLEGKLNE
ncbi:MAG: dUTPase [Thermanaeromonas sp.]|uniref:dUTPase n=1 Tax=Thermanaeromonas sp. TaxID=2003697 RepID=UPI00243FC583|nr:dUTPase [Thermanaeromonas sp.]MCG0277273.1 dUTPase [Thermanaeromonas sp.]